MARDAARPSQAHCGTATSTLACWSLLAPLSLALLYSASAHLFQAAWHDVPWRDADRCRSTAGRAALLGAGAAATKALAASRTSSSTSSIISAGTTATTTVLTVLSTAASAYLIQQTRQLYVQGPHRTAALSSSSNTLKGRVYFVTGANTGVGYATARQLYDAGATVVLGCRSEDRARVAMERIRFESSRAATGSIGNAAGNDNDDNDDGRLVFVQIDVSDLASVRRAAARFQSLSLPLHVLVLNAGIMMPDRRESADGHELTLAANHLGHFLLTDLLLPSLRRAAAGAGAGGDTDGDARVVVLTSSTYRLASPGIDLGDLQCLHRKYTMFGQYAQTKLANILFVKELARREEQRQRQPQRQRRATVEAEGGGAEAEADDEDQSTTNAVVKAYAVHPGLVRTDVVRNMPWYLYYPNAVFGFAVAAFQKTPEAGAWTTVYCATSDEVREESGGYYANSRREPVEDFADDAEAASKLWTLSEELVGLAR